MVLGSDMLVVLNCGQSGMILERIGDNSERNGENQVKSKGKRGFYS